MKHLVLFLVLALLAWGVWTLLGSGGDGPDGPHDDRGWIDEPGAGDDGMRGADPNGRGAGDPSAPRGVDGRPVPGEGTQAAGDVEIVGRVVDRKRRPVAGASVELRLPGRGGGSAETGPEGVYVLRTAAGRTQRGILIARKEGHGAGSAPVWLAEPGQLDPPVLVLEAAHVLRVRAEADGKPSPFTKIALARRSGGHVVAFGQRPAANDGVAVFDGLPAGLYEIYASLPGRGRGTAHARLPQAKGETAVVSLGGERLLDVRVEDAETGEPVVGASVEVGDKQTLPRPNGPGYLPPLPAATTNRDGRATVRGLGLRETLYVNARAPGYLPGLWWRASTQVAREGQSEVVVRLRRPRTITFPIYRGEAQPPGDGTVLDVQIAARTTEGMAEATAVVDGPYVRIDGLPAVHVQGTLVAPGGLQGSFIAPAGADMGNAIEFKAPRTVRILLVEPGGTPVEGVGIRLASMDGAGRITPKTTGKDGIVEFEGVGGRMLGVHRRVPESPWGGPLLGRIDLDKPEDPYTFELQERVGFRLRVRIGGEAGLPGRFDLTVGGRRLGGDAIIEDAVAGTLEVHVRPPSTAHALRARLTAPGYLPAVVTVDPTDDGASYDVELEAAGRIVARVKPPEDGSYALALQRLDADGGWVPTAGAAGPGAEAQNAKDGVHVYDGLAAGRYRLTETRSGFESGPITVVPGAAAATVRVDLSASLDVQGKVQVPPGTNMAQVRVLVKGRHDPDNAWSGVRVGPDGSFKVRALRGASMELMASHPTLSVPERGGRVRVAAGGGAVTLRLVAGAEAHFRVVGFETTKTPLKGIWNAPVQVKLYRGKVGDELVRTVQPLAAEGTFTFGGFEPGTYAIWVGFGTKYAPHVIPSASLGRGRTDLGSITPSLGSTLVIEAPSAREQSGLWASATAVGGPAYARHASSGRDGTLRITGLAKGSFRVLVRASSPDGQQVLFDDEVRVDGSGETRLQVGR